MSHAVLPFTAMSAVPTPPPMLGSLLRHHIATRRDVQTGRAASELRLHGGTQLTLRPIEPQDADALAALIARLSPSARRNRFHGAVQVSVDDARKMCCLEGIREVAFVVTAKESGVECVVADARYCVDKNTDAVESDSAEFAVMVDERWQRRGLGGWAMAALTDAAQTAGLHWLHGEVLSTNLPMLRLMRCCGLCCTPDAEDDGLVQVQERLGLAGGFPTHPQPRTAIQKLQHWITR